MGKSAGRVLAWVISIAAIAAAVAWGQRYLIPGASVSDAPLTFEVSRRTLVDTVVERGTVESQNTIDGKCDLPGDQNKIIFIVPEGSQVAQGDVVVRFDSDEVDRMIIEKSIALNEAQGKLDQAREDLDIQKNKNETDIAAAELELSLAELDLEKYEKGDYVADKADLERSILEGEAELEKTRDELNNMRSLVKKGFRSPEQLREMELRFNSMQHRVDRDKQKMRVLEDFDYRRKMTELEAKAFEAQKKLERAKTTASAEERKANANIQNAESAVKLLADELADLQSTKQLCEIKAPQAGTVAYANQPWYDDSQRIREGATVYRQQSIFVLPDLSRMQVKLQIHESVINKVKSGMKATLRIDAFPEIKLDGAVKFVSALAQSSFLDSKKYEVVVLIDSFPTSMDLKPGMTAQVEILVGTYENVVAVPVNALTEHLGQTYVYLMRAGASNRKAVQVGRSNHAFVELTEGIEIGDRVALDAYQRGLAEFEEIEDDALQQRPIPPPVLNASSPQTQPTDDPR